MSNATAPVASDRERADQRKHTCANCLRGNHKECTIPERCVHLDCDKERKPAQFVPPSSRDLTPYQCPDCATKFASPQALGSHRRYQHGRGDAREQTPPPAPKAAAAASKPAVVIELVDDEPPPPAPKKKPAEQILELVTAADLSDGGWKRCAVFPTRQSAKRMATRLTGDAPSYEWRAVEDGRLFVRVATAEG